MKKPTIKELVDEDLISPPADVIHASYQIIHGSHAYGVSTDDSDLDILGFCVPPIDQVFPHLRGEIKGFGKQKQGFDQYSKHHIDRGGQDVDVTIYNIVKFFDLAMDNNPNVLELLFTPEDCVISADSVAKLVRDNAVKFLHKGAYYRFRGFAYSQIHKARKKVESGDRDKSWVDKKIYHAVRLLLQVEQILEYRRLDLRANTEVLSDIRDGNWTYEEAVEWHSVKEEQLTQLYEASAIPHSPDQDLIRDLLLTCLYEYWGELPSNLALPPYPYRHF
jgi:predicted nucleotidyltransferase